MTLPSVRALRAPLLIAAVVAVVDQATKHWALQRLSGGRTVDVVGSLRFNLAFNRGMAFSQGTGLGPV
ncbi:MAG: signal peptidase II, partial [Ilumatobacteraceae bacterium]